ncbi:hypothetical protein AGMMS49546_39250 [Spirochaetia bacterium]|nr:hypothetical protein AGMMS49546_39250 [Spirochaetia bacterium]
MYSALMTLKQKIIDAAEARAKAEAVVEENLKRLKEHGYSSMDDAQAALKRLRDKIEVLQEDVAGEIEDILERYPDLRDDAAN